MEVLDALRDMVWNVPSFDDPDEPPRAFLMLRAHIHTQLLFQLSESRSFMRWPALIARLSVDHPTRAQFQDLFKMEPDTWCALACATLAAAFQGNAYIRPSWFDPLRASYGVAVDAFLEEIARDSSELREELRDALHERIYELKEGRRQARKNGAARLRYEMQEFPWVAQYPLLKHRSGNFVVWHRLILARGLEQAVHSRLATLGQAYTDPFSKVFESYVVELARWSGLPVIDEAAYAAAGNRGLKSVDAIIPLGTANILIESKMSLFHEQVMVSDKAPQVFMKLRRIREAIHQGWEVGRMLRDGYVALEQCATAPEDFLLIVTSRQLNMGSGEHLKRMFGDDVLNRLNPEARAGSPSPAQIERLPARNIFVLDVEEFEHLTGAVQAGDIDLVELLSSAAAACHDPTKSTLHFDQILGPHCKRWHTSPLMTEAIGRVENELRRSLMPDA